MTVLLKNPNFLILDEPTNDLDLLTLNKLEEFLAFYPGCLVLVSHDRYFIDKLVDHLFIFEGDGTIKDYNSTYTEYRLQRIAEEVSDYSNPTSESKKPTRPSGKDKNEMRRLEREIGQLEERKTHLENKLSEPNLTLEQITDWSKELGL